jgi:NAD(P)-dependent dehydrogenase (short-subunit alcohol dehydrogenase family)
MELRGRGAATVAEVCDVTEHEQTKAFLDHVRRTFGQIDVLINNAGIIEVGPLDTMTRADFEQALAVHFWAPWQTMNLVLPDMRRRGEGRIVNVASIGGRIAVPHLAPYCASKFALVGLSRSFRTELARENIFVTTVCPGLMRTGSHRHALFKGQFRAEYLWFTLGASAPLAAMSAERAASQILWACRYGRAQATLSLPARFAEAVDVLAPEAAAGIATIVARLMPGSDGAESVGSHAVEGQDATSAWSPSLATVLGERAALRNNE